jgi:hypothetical protein
LIEFSMVVLAILGGLPRRFAGRTFCPRNPSQAAGQSTRCAEYF